MGDAIPQQRVEEKVPVRKYRVLSPRFVHGKVGEVIELQLTDNQELSLLETGAIERFTERPSVAENKKGEANA